MQPGEWCPRGAKKVRERGVTSWFRNSLYSSMALLWITGCLWLLLRYYSQVEATSPPHPLQPGLLVVHGVLALAAIFFFGWLAGSSVGESWWQHVERSTAITMLVVLGVLTVTGICCYYVTTERVRASMALVHETLGAIVILPALAYWLRRRNTR
jgi:hypothetical protein